MSIYYSKIFLKGTDYRVSRSPEDEIFYRFEGYTLVSTLPPIVPAELSTDTDLLVAPLIPGPSDTATAIDLKFSVAMTGKADLVGGVVPTSQIPSIALTNGQVVADRAALLALSNVQQGDIGVVSGTADKGTYILTTADPTVFANWLLLNTPTDVVQSVNGQSGTVILSKADIGLGSATDTADADKPVSTAQQTALNLKANTADVYDKTASDAKIADASLLTAGTVADARLPSTAQAATLSSTYAPVAEPIALTKANKSGLRVSVWDYGVIGDGVADDSAALQAAITAAGIGGYIDAGKGTHTAAVFKCLTGLTMLNFQILDGSSMQVGVGATAAAEIRFPNFTAAEIGLTLGNTNTVRNVVLRGPGSAVGTCKGIVNTSTARLHHVSIIHWFTGVALTNAYYSGLWDCELSRNGVGLLLSGCFNIGVHGTRINCSSSDGTTYGQGISTGSVRGLTINGGSIENFGISGGISIGSQSVVNVHGTYFESSVIGAGGYGITSPITADKVTLNIRGATVYLTSLGRFVSASGWTNSVINGSGNHFICAAGSSTIPRGYVLGTPAATSEINLWGDNWKEVGTAGGQYTDWVNHTFPGAHVEEPKGFATYGTRAYLGRKQSLPVGTTVDAPLNVPHGVAPTTPVDGDMWTTTAGLYVRINGATVGPLT